MSTNLKNDVYNAVSAANVICLTCKYVQGRLNNSNDDIEYFCSKLKRPVDKYDRCNDWNTNFETVEISTPAGKLVKIDMATQKWKSLTGSFTPGGDPAYIYPKCKSKESEHIHGIESHITWNYCPICGTKLEY